ncbi:dihydrofolate reductase family protein [Actinomadura adrarensis]|uniref:Dihydrofolate reductase family protein n=1 Tax=Actinomadura adrarensis TaxID=1819600 RepID=A0ABW3CP98_9ACTN
MPRESRKSPQVVAHVAVSLEGATTGFQPDLGTFYELAGTFGEDVTLVGADTILAQESTLATAPRPGPAQGGPLLAVVDGKARVSEWDALREVGHWSDVLALHCESTPPRPPERHVREVVMGRERVDLAAAIEELGRLAQAEHIRVDSGGALLAALLRGHLLDEVSLLVHPVLVGGNDAKFWYGTRSGQAAVDFELIADESLGGGLVWLRYRPRNQATTGE